MKVGNKYYNNEKRQRLPSWMKHRVRETDRVISLKKTLKSKNINKVCKSAGCQNIYK